MLIAALSALTACGGSTPSAEGIDLRPPDSAVTEPCADATALPGRALTQAEAERAWIRDRASLAECRGRHGLAVEWIEGVIELIRQ